MTLNPPLPEIWRKEAERLRRIEQASPAAVYELCADEFDSWWREYGDVVLNLQEAARESGYSPDHLGRMVRQGKIANAGCENAPKIRRRDLPRKPGHKPEGLPRRWRCPDYAELCIVGATSRKRQAVCFRRPV